MKAGSSLEKFAKFLILLIIVLIAVSMADCVDNWGSFDFNTSRHCPPPLAAMPNLSAGVNTTYTPLHDCSDIALEVEAYLNSTGWNSERVTIDNQTNPSGPSHMINILQVPISNGKYVSWEFINHYYSFRKDQCHAWRCVY